MTLHRTSWWLAAAAAGVVVAPTSACRAAPVEAVQREGELQPLDEWSCVFAGREVVCRYRWEAEETKPARGEWQFWIGDRVVARGDMQPRRDARNDAGDQYSATVRMPPLKQGIVVSGELRVAMTSAVGELFVHRRPLHVFSETPFAGGRREREEWDVALFDPLETTAGLLDDAGIPYQRRLTLASVAELQNGLLVVGAGASKQSQSNLGPAILGAAQRGVRVLCLAPDEGELGLDSARAAGRPRPARLLMADDDILCRFDKRFDVHAWLGGPSARSRWQLVAADDRLAVQVTEAPMSWPWIELRFPGSPPTARQGGVIICGFDIVGQWHDSPVPRYLLPEILASLHDAPASLNEEFSYATR